MHLFADVSEHVTDPWLRRAFLLAERGRGSASPNPIVGCVIVCDDDGTITTLSDADVRLIFVDRGTT